MCLNISGGRFLAVKREHDVGPKISRGGDEQTSPHQEQYKAVGNFPQEVLHLLHRDSMADICAFGAFCGRVWPTVHSKTLVLNTMYHTKHHKTCRILMVYVDITEACF